MVDIVEGQQRFARDAVIQEKTNTVHAGVVLGNVHVDVEPEVHEVAEQIGVKAAVGDDQDLLRVGADLISGFPGDLGGLRVSGGIDQRLQHTLGSTVLFTYFGRPYTLEALVYGFAIGGMIVSVILWFSCYGVIMTSDKFTSLFAPIIPAVSLLLVMVLRLVPSYWRKAKQVSAARKCIGKVGADTAKGKIAEGASVLSALSMWALEGSVMTADSMRARGYGTARRSSFQLYRFRVNDAAFAIIMLAAAIFVIVGASGGCTAVSFVPDISVAEADGFLAAYAILMLMPSIIEIRELFIWNYSISKI